MSIAEKIQKLTSQIESDGLRKILANIGWLFADKVLRMGSSLVVGVWIARYLGVKDFGLFNYTTAFVMLFTPLATLGLDNIVVRELTRSPTRKEEILGTTFWLKLFAGGISALLALTGISFIRPNDPTAILLVAILAMTGVGQALDAIDYWFQSQVESKNTVIAKNTAFVLVAISKVILILNHASVIAFAWAALAEILLGSLGLAISYQLKGFSIWKWRWNLGVARSLLTESLPLIFSSLAIMIYMKIDQIMLGDMIGDRAVGIYSAATRISEVWYFIPVSVAASVSPAIYKAKEISETLYYQRIEQLNRWLVLMAISVVLPITFLATPAVTLLFGDKYIEAGNILVVHIWTAIFVFTGVATAPWFISEELNYLSMYQTLIGAIVNVILNLLLIPPYSGLGAAIATVISQAFASFFLNAVHPKTRKLFYLQLKFLAISTRK